MLCRARHVGGRLRIDTVRILAGLLGSAWYRFWGVTPPPETERTAHRPEIPVDHYASPVANMLAADALLQGEPTPAMVQRARALLATAQVQQEQSNLASADRIFERIHPGDNPPRREPRREERRAEHHRPAMSNNRRERERPSAAGACPDLQESLNASRTARSDDCKCTGIL